MSWNRSIGPWTELKGKARKHLSRFKSKEIDGIDISHSLQNNSHTYTRNQADQYLDNIHSFQKNMKDYNFANSELLKKDSNENSTD